MLTHEENSWAYHIASIGFDIFERGIITVKQIQGVKDPRGMINRWKSLRPFRWQKLLLIVVVDWASKYGLKQVRVISAEYHPWRESMGKQKAKLYYDVTPKSCGFERVKVEHPSESELKDFWYLDLDAYREAQNE